MHGFIGVILSAHALIIFKTSTESNAVQQLKCNLNKTNWLPSDLTDSYGNPLRRRKWPFCVGEDVLKDYVSQLSFPNRVLREVLTFKEDSCSENVDIPLSIMEIGVTEIYLPHILEFKFSRIQNYAPKRETRYKGIKTLNQWIHITIIMKYPIEALFVQANVLPYGLPYGQFDIDFTCNDCNQPDVLKSKLATVMPCSRRTHMHSQHPNIYVFSSNPSDVRSEFHMNYNFLDTTCRETKFIQFLVYYSHYVDYGVTPGAWLNLMGAFYTKIFDHHSIHESLDGMQYPAHPEMYPDLKCHGPDQYIHFNEPLDNIENETIKIYTPYEECLLSMVTNRSDLYIEKGDMFQSDRICNNIPRTYCPYDQRTELNKCHGFDQDDHAFKQCDNSGSMCGDNCVSLEDNNWANEMYRRLIRRIYAARKGHGALMIAAVVALSVVSIHIARYFKETGHGCLMVGRWMWVHFAFSMASLLLLWGGIAMVIAMPNRGHSIPNNRFRPSDFTDARLGRRDRVVERHYIIGVATMVVFHYVIIFGGYRPLTGRFVWLFSHVFLGYFTVFLGVLSTWISTACLETQWWTILMAVAGIVPWAVACALQVRMDSAESKTSHTQKKAALRKVANSPAAESAEDHNVHESPGKVDHSEVKKNQAGGNDQSEGILEDTMGKTDTGKGQHGGHHHERNQRGQHGRQAGGHPEDHNVHDEKEQIDHSGDKLNRSYFPVIQAICVARPMPMKMARAALLTYLSVFIYIVVWVVVGSSNYVGILVHNPCKNCPWKLDEVILIGLDDPGSANKFMKDAYRCEWEEDWGEEFVFWWGLKKLIYNFDSFNNTRNNNGTIIGTNENFTNETTTSSLAPG